MTTEELLSCLESVRRSGRGWMARCPAHADRTPSLSITAGDDGRILLHDFGGCPTAEIVKALGLAISDLFQSQNLPPQLIRDAKRQRVQKLRQREAEYHRAGLLSDAVREAESLIEASRGISVARWSNERLARELDRLADAYGLIEQEMVDGQRI